MYNEVLSQREIDVIAILTRSEEPLTAAQVVDKRTDLTQSTATVVLRNLLEAGYVEVAGVTHSGKVLSRQYSLTDAGRNAIREYLCSIYTSIADIVSITQILKSIFDEYPLSNEEFKEFKKVVKEIGATCG